MPSEGTPRFQPREKSGASRKRHALPHGLAILFEDTDLLIVNKPAGLLSVASNSERERTAHFLLTQYLQRGCGRCRKRLYIVHRLDRYTSGVLVFAKSEEAQFRLKESWKETKKKYLAVAHGRFEKKSDIITSYLLEGDDQVVRSTPDKIRGKLSRTAYTVVKEHKGMSLLEIDLLTGRKNQIRVHLAGIGHPVVGDQKYGTKSKGPPRLALHARSIDLKRPFSNARIAVEAEVPDMFTTLVGPLSL